MLSKTGGSEEGNSIARSMIREGWSARGRRAVIFLIAGGLLFTSWSAKAREVDERYEFDITQHTLGEALTALSRQAQTPLLYPYDLADQTGINPVVGRYSVSEAIDELLRGTSISGGLTKGGVITVSPMKNKDQDREDEVNQRIVKSSLLAGVSALFGFSEAMAQDDVIGNEGVGAGVAKDDVIVVTATRRAENLQDVPLSISALNGADMALRGIENFEDFARLIPGLNLVQSSQQFSKFTIRGINNTLSTASNGEQKLAAVYIDEVPISSFSVVTPNIRLVDIERVEVLRGPQGTLFGSGSLSGAVRILTRKPELGKFATQASVDIGSRDGEIRQRYTGVVNLPLGDKAALRAVGYYRQEPGYIDNIDLQIGREDINESDEWGGRISLRLEPTDNLTAIFMVMHDDVETKGLNLFDPTLGKHTASYGFDNTIDVETTNYNATIELELDWATLTSSTTYAKARHDWDFDSGILDLFVAQIPQVYSEISDQSAIVEEVRIVSNGDSPFQWLLGGFFIDRDTDWRSVLGYRNESPLDPALDGVADFNITGLPMTISEGVEPFASFADRNYREQAIFGELSYQLSEQLKATVGLRYAGSRFLDIVTDEGYSAFTPFITGFFVGGANIDVSMFQTSELVVGTEDLKYVLTKRFSLTWQPTENHTFYVTAADGFRRQHPNTGGFVNGGASVTDPMDPVIIPQFARSDSLWNYELGMKADWFDGRLRTNVALYYIPWKDMQIALARGDGTVFTGNVGKSELKGIEAEIWAHPVETLDMGLSLTLQTGKITELSDEDALLSGAVLDAQLSAPEYQIAGFVQKNWPIGNGQDVFARIDVQHIGGYPNGFPNALATGLPNPRFTDVDAIENVDISVGWQNRNLNITLYAQNLLDNDEYSYISPANVTTRFGTLPPRTFGVRATWTR